MDLEDRGRRKLGVNGSEVASAADDTGEHGVVQPARVGVAQRGMVADEQVQTVGKNVLCAVGEAEGRACADDLCMEEMGEKGVEGYFAETDDDPDAREGGEFMAEVVAAVANLLREGLVSRRGATDDGGDPGVAELEAVVDRGGRGLVGEAEFMEDRVHELS